MELTDCGVIRGLMARHGFSPEKGLGQNFIINPEVPRRMARLALPRPGMGALEIGPGIGALTRELSAAAEAVVAVEIDKKLPPVLAETLAGCSNVQIVCGDALELDLAALAAERMPGLPFVVCANLPYGVTTPLILRLLTSRLPAQSLTLMVQKEAADRLCARPGERLCGAANAAVWYYSTPEKLFDVSRGSFFPAPEVDSTVIRLTVNSAPPVDADEARFFAAVKAAFAQRRKTVANSLSAALPLEKSAVAAALELSGIPPKARAEELTLAQFAALSRALPR